jgi:5-carboxymethyl-2-hydroxymuconate isomerase
MIPDIETFLPVAIFKMATTIPHKFNIVRFLKMATGRNFLMSGINSGHHNLPTYEMALKSDNVKFVRYCGGHFENGDR